MHNINRANTRIAIWISYDIGNTTFFAGIMGILFPLWMTDVMKGNDATLGFTLTIAMAMVLVLSPILGTFSDHIKRRMPFVIVFTIICIIATAFIGIEGSDGNIYISLCLFAIAVMAIHTADIFYNTLIDNIASKENIGTISGLGIGIGYIGAIVSVFSTILFLDSLGHIFVIRCLAIFMTILMIPLLIFGRDKPRNEANDDTDTNKPGNSTFNRLAIAFQEIRNHATWRRFLLARFWYMWSVNAAGSFAVLYGVNTIGLPAKQVQIIIFMGILFGIPSAVFWGRLADRYGASMVLKTCVSMLLFLLILAVLIPIWGLPSLLWGIVGICSGISLAGLYVSEKPLILSMAPNNRKAEYFGINSISGRLAAMIAPFSWGFISVTMNLGQIASVIWLIICLSISVILLAGMRVTPSDYESEIIKQ